MDVGETPYFREGDLVLCKLRHGFKRLVLVLDAQPYQLWRGQASNNRWRYTVLRTRGEFGGTAIGKMHLKPEWLLQRITGGGQDGKR
jgi:hypothetical protein